MWWGQRVVHNVLFPWGQLRWKVLEYQGTNEPDATVRTCPEDATCHQMHHKCRSAADSILGGQPRAEQRGHHH